MLVELCVDVKRNIFVSLMLSSTLASRKYMTEFDDILEYFSVSVYDTAGV